VKKMSEANNEATTNFEGSSLVENSKQERLYGEKGFTNKIIEKLGDKLRRNPYDKTYLGGTITSQDLLSIVPLIPEENLEDRQNDSPTLRDFIEVARKEPNALFEVYVITEDRDDERITVDGVYIPIDNVVDFLYSKALEMPNEEYITEDGKYRYMWWD
jgi:hypothetical protein